MACCGPGYATPLDAMKGPKEEIIYIVCIQPESDKTQKPDYLSTVDVNPESSTYGQVIHRTHMKYVGDELHHSGWNICSSCHNDKTAKRDKLVLPCLMSDRVYIVDTGKNPRAPELHKVIEPEELHKFNCSFPHTAHCLASGEIMISTLGDSDGNNKGDFILIDSKTLQVKGSWTKGDKFAGFGYDFWYQPYWDVMISTEWGTPKVIKTGFAPRHSDPSTYGRSLNFYSWSERKLIQTINLGEPGTAPLEVRFLHDPKASEGYVGCCLYSIIYHFSRNSSGVWEAEKVIEVPPKKVTGWIGGDSMNGSTTDILLSLDDKYLYMSNWLHGDVRQYDITNRRSPKLTGQVFLNGSIVSDSIVKVTEDLELKSQPDPVYVKGKRLHASPQMLQLSLDGKRLYVSSSLFSPWDKQFYPETITKGSWMVKLNVDTENGGMSLDPDFMVDFGSEPDGPVYAHEMRYPGGDCTSDIWLAE